MIASYYNYNFTDTKALYARVKEEFSSYFESGMLDDTLMDSYVIDCLDRLGKGMYKIDRTLLRLENHEASLPDDFIDIREVFIAHEDSFSYELPGATYTQKMKDTAHKLWEDVDVRCHPCDSCKNPNKVEAIYKVNRTVLFSWERHKRLLPRPILDVNRCAEYYTYDIHDCKLVSPIKEGFIEIAYYQDAFNSDGDLAIPDNIKIKTYIEEYLKYKLYFKLFNAVSDESVSTVRVKMEMQRQLAERAFVSAKIEAGKQTKEQKIRRMSKGTRHMNQFEIPRQYFRNRRY